MIYFLDNSLQLQKIVTSKNIISAVHEHELNGLIRADVELDLSYANKFLVLGIDHVGYYYKDEFYLHKIQRVEYDHVNETAMVVLRHIFFEDMIFGKLIRDVRPQNQDALSVSRQTIDANTRWQTIMTDVTGRLSTNFYWQVPYEVIEFMTENYRIEFLPKILFDGRKINGFQLHLANKVGEDKNIRIPYGSRVLDLKYEEDYSEIITKLVVHGKGEEVGDGYGRRINISDVNFSKNGVVSPVGSLYLEDKSITNTYGNDGQTPREGREVFEDIEDANELAEAGYQHYLQVSRPQMLFTADVADIGDVGIGDSVVIIRQEYDVYFKARIHKLSVDLLYPEDAQVELGDYKHFKESKISRKTREKNNRIQRQLSDRITRLKQEANDRFDNEVKQWFEEYEQALIDVHAEIKADRENMTNLIDTKTKEFDESLEAGMAEAERKRQENYEAISDHVNTTVDNTRSELETSINSSIESAKSYAEQQAQEKSDAVKSELETVTNGHQQMLDDLESNVMNIDDFIGDKTIGLNELLQNERILFEEKLNNVDTWHYNMLRGSRFDEPAQIKMWNGSIKTDEEVPYYMYNNNPYQGWVEFTEEIQFESGQQYTLSFDVQTLGVKKMDYTFIIASPNDDVGTNMQIHRADIQDSGTNNNIFLFSQYRRYWIKFTPDRDILGTVRIGSNLVNNERGYQPFKIRLPYLTTTDNTRWLYHQLDSSQNIEEITRRVMQLEDGFEEVITRTEYDFKTGEIDGTIKTVLETVDESSLIIQNHEDWILTNGASIERTVDGFESKAWLSDIHNPNLMSFSDVTKQSSRDIWDSPGSISYLASDGFIRMYGSPNNSLSLHSPNVELSEGSRYTLTFESLIGSAYNLTELNQTFVVYPNAISQRLDSDFKKQEIGSAYGVPIYKYTVSFIARETTSEAKIYFGANPINSGQRMDIFIRKPKVELGNRSTPYVNAFSGLQQRADEIALAVQGIDGEGYLTQSDILIRSNYVQLGSQRIDGSNIGALLRVSPTGIDAVAEAMRLSGDLYVDGDITALAVKAIEGNFAKLFANQLTATTITGDLIASRTITSENIHVDHALVNRIIAQSVYANDVTSKIGNFIDLNAGNIVAAGLTANVITADHIQVGTSLIDKLFATSARIDQLITKTHFVNEMHALTLNVVELNASQIRTRLLSANTIEASWLKSGTALLDRVFSSTAMFERMMAKSGFITTLNTVTIDTDRITIRRKDGGALISEGMQMFGSPIITKPFMSGEVEFEGQNYITSNRGAQTFEVAYAEHAGRYARFNFNVSLRHNSIHASALVGIVVRRGTSPSGVHIPHVYEEVMAYRDSGSRSYNVDVPMPVPTFGAVSWTLEFYVIGDPGNIARIRSGRCWILG